MSRNIATVGIAVAVAVSFLFVGAGAVAAHNGGNDVGVSGNCGEDTDGDGEQEHGGGGSVGVSSDGSVDATDQGEIESVIAGLQYYGQQNQEHDRADTCDGGGDDNTYDYLEAHAGNGDQQVQACFSEDTNQNEIPVSAGTGDQCEDPSLS